MEKLNLFFDRIKDLSFWQRLFQWRRVRNLSFDAYEEFRALARETEAVRETAGRLQNRITELSAHNENLSRRVHEMEVQSARKDANIEELNGRLREDSASIQELTKKWQVSKPHVKTTLKTITRTSHG